MPPRREALRVLAELLEARLRQAHLVLVVVDRERRAVAEPVGLAAQDAAARGVEGEDPDRARGAAEHVSMRSRISPAALFVKVIARISFGFTFMSTTR